MLKALYSGKIIPWERRNRGCREQQELLRQIEAEEKYIAEKLAPEDGERFKAFLNLQKEFDELTEIEIFSYAFSFGALLMVDVCEEVQAMALEE